MTLHFNNSPPVMCYFFSGPLVRVCVSKFLFTPSLSFSTLSGFLYASVTHRCSFKDAADKESQPRFAQVLTVSSIRPWQPEANQLNLLNIYDVQHLVGKCVVSVLSVHFYSSIWKMAARGEFLPAKSEFVLGADQNAFRW